MKIKNITEYLEILAPLQYQEGYDNCGLIIGSVESEVTNILISLDVTEAIIDEAIENNCNLIVAHHPLIFGGIKKITGKNFVERSIIKAIQNNIAVYAIHTNLDNVFDGVNQKICEKLGLKNLKILSTKENLACKIVTYVPLAYAEEVRSAMFTAGAGNIGNYDMCSFNVEGNGTFRGNKNSNPFSGNKNELHKENEIKIETIAPMHLAETIVKSIISAHPYEEVAYDIYTIKNKLKNVGSGMIGELEKAISVGDWMNYLKEKMELKTFRYTSTFKNEIKKIAVCGGAGSFLLNDALKCGADAFVTADFKYHEFFNAEQTLIICDIGHYESEIFTTELLKEKIQKKFPTFAVRISKTNTNPVHYF